jgi:hypothetical protein
MSARPNARVPATEVAGSPLGHAQPARDGAIGGGRLSEGVDALERPGRWVTPALVAASYLVATVLNAGALLFGGRPSVAAVVSSWAYLFAWLVHAFAAGRWRRCRSLRSMVVFWAVAVGGTAICGTFLRLNLGTGAAIPGGWVAPAILLVVAAPLYGLAGWWGADPLGVLVGVAVASAALTGVTALAARSRRPRPGI